MKTYPKLTPARLAASLPPSCTPADIERIRIEVDRLGSAAQYGWGHTIDFGPFKKDGLLLDSYLNIAGGFDQFGWWPSRLEGLHVADIGCYTGGISFLMAERGAACVYAIDEIPEHVAQCEFVARELRLSSVRPILRTVYQLQDVIQPGSLDIVVFSGILYHLSDMLVGLHTVRELLKPGGIMLIESNGVDEFDHSYANFGRFFGGMWWQPTGLCIKDMCDFMGFDHCEVQFYEPNRCIARAIRSERGLNFRRGLNATFSSMHDSKPRTLDPSVMAPAPIAPRSPK